MSSLRIFSILYLYRIKQARSSGSNCVYVVLLFFLFVNGLKLSKHVKITVPVPIPSAMWFTDLKTNQTEKG
jgi:hypothetical protein